MTFIPLARIARVPAVVLLVWAIVAIVAPPAMARYAPFSLGRGAGLGCQLQQVFGFGSDEHIVLPLVAVAIPAITVTAQLVGVRVSEVLDADFIVTANAKGLLPLSIARVHVLPHAWPVVVEALGSGLRISVASL